MMRTGGIALLAVATLVVGAEAQEMDGMQDMDEMHEMGEMHEISAVGVFNLPMGAMDPGVLAPGHIYEVDFEAAPGARLSFATMFVHSNDWFYAPGSDGIALFDGMGHGREGDVTAEVSLWDAGTEADQKPGEGSDQAPRQGGPDMGAVDPMDRVRAVDVMMDSSLPPTDRVLRVTLEHGGMGMGELHRFTLRIENVATDAMLMTSTGSANILLAPGVWVVHGEGAMPLFHEGAPDRGLGLEALAEDGDPSALAEALRERVMM